MRQKYKILAKNQYCVYNYKWTDYFSLWITILKWKFYILGGYPNIVNFVSGTTWIFVDKELKVITIESDFGAGKKGAKLGPQATLKQLQILGNQTFCNSEVIRVKAEGLETENLPPFSKNIESIFDVHQRALFAVESVLSENKFPFVISGDHSNGAAVISAIKKIAVRGAWYKPLKIPAIPTITKLLSGKSMSNNKLIILATKNPKKPPTNKEGAKFPPLPPLPKVIAVATGFKKSMKSANNTMNQSVWK